MTLLKKKSHKAYKKYKSQKSHTLQFGNFGLQNLQHVRLTEIQVQNFHWIIKKLLKNSKSRYTSKFWNRLNLNLNLTKQNLESRMGKGKGNIYTKAQFLKIGTVIFEFSFLDRQTEVKFTKNLPKIFPSKLVLIKRFT